MKVLIAEDNADTRFYYDVLFQKYRHVLISARDGLECLKIYHDEFENIRLQTDAMQKIQPFDAVVLDYKMPGRDGLEVAKEILAVNPHQRIIFASAYVRDILMVAVRQLRQLVELVQKPFNERQFIEVLEDAEVQGKTAVSGLLLPRITEFERSASLPSFDGTESTVTKE